MFVFGDLAAEVDKNMMRYIERTEEIENGN